MKLRINSRSILPYLRNRDPAYRSVGYLAFHASAREGVILSDLAEELVACLNRERRGTIEKNGDTRPLWRLLVCIQFLFGGGISTSQRLVILTALCAFQDYSSTILRSRKVHSNNPEHID
jgi:hypothetical protein